MEENRLLVAFDPLTLTPDPEEPFPRHTLLSWGCHGNPAASTDVRSPSRPGRACVQQGDLKPITRGEDQHDPP
ncbi:hypothetical protein SRHO_G00062890 [Serrasalmus rhombeus]